MNAATDWRHLLARPAPRDHIVQVYQDEGFLAECVWGAGMPLGQATLLWLKQNMPLTAEKVLAGVRARC